MQIRRRQTRTLRLERRGRRLGLLKRPRVLLVRQNLLEHLEHDRLAAPVRCRCGGHAEFLDCRGRVVSLRTRDPRAVGCLFAIAILGVEVRLGFGFCLFDVEVHIAWIRDPLGCIDGPCNLSYLGTRGLELRAAHGGLATIRFDQLVAVPESSAGFDDDFDAGLLGHFHDLIVSIAGVGVCVFFEDEVGDFPGFEELR